jgi:hypothetical protein
MRVCSGNRVMTVLAAVKDEMQGSDFLESMSEKEFNIFQKRVTKSILRVTLIR